MRALAPAGSNRLLLAGTVLFIAISCYTIVVLHNLHLSSYFDASAISHVPASLIASKLFGHASLDTSSPEQLTARLKAHGTFAKYDADKDGRMSEQEFHAFLLDLVKSSMSVGKQPQQQGAAQKPAGQAAAAAAAAAVPAAAAAAAPAAAAAAATAPATDAKPAAAVAAPVVAAPVVAAPVVAAPVVAAPVVAAPVVAAPVVAAAKPGPGCPELTKELVASFARNGTIMLTVCDWRIFATFGINWMKHLNNLGVAYYLVGATDRQTSEFLSGQGNHPCFKFFEEGTGANTGNTYQYGSDHYRAATWRKVTVVEKIVGWGFNVLHSDVDVVWFQDPLPYFLGPQCKQVDVAVSADLVGTGNAKHDDGLEVWLDQGINVNTGIYFVKATPGGKHYMGKWAALRATRSGDNDQVGLYHYIRTTLVFANTSARRLEMDAGSCEGQAPEQLRECAARKPMLGTLSVSVVLNGYSYFIPKLHELQGVKPLGIHMTWLPLSREGKFHRMRDGMLYHDPPEYYSGPNFITADLDFPTAPQGYNKWMDSEAMIQVHLLAMDKQLVQVYRVMAMAVMLNRTLILPKMHCFCYKNWFMMDQCRIPGDHATTFPMQCQLDQWLRPKVLYNYGPFIVGEDGPREFGFREHSLLENPRFPDQIRKQQLVVEPGPKACGEAGQACEASEQAVPAGSLRAVSVPKSLTQKQLVQVLSKYKDVKLIRLRKPMRLFGGFDDLKLKESFNQFVDKVASNWCCRDKPYVDKGMSVKEKLFITEALTVRRFLEPKKEVNVSDPTWR